MKPHHTLAVIGALALSACADKEAESVPASKAPAARVVGKAVNCVQISQIRTTRVHDDSTIDFVMAGGKVYRNTLPYSCPGLGFEQAFSYETSQSQLCSVDIIHVLYHSPSLHKGAACGLGKFVPVKLEMKRK